MILSRSSSSEAKKRYRGPFNRRLLFRETCQWSKNLLCFGCTVPRSRHRSIAQALGRSVDRSGRRSTRHSQTTPRTHGRTGRRAGERMGVAVTGQRMMYFWTLQMSVGYLCVSNCLLLSVNISLITKRYAIGYATVCEHFIDHLNLFNIHIVPHCYLLKLQAACLGFLKLQAACLGFLLAFENSRCPNASTSCSCRRVFFEACELLSPSCLTQLHD